MKHVIRPRQGGKSTELIRRSAGLCYPIICRDQAQARWLKEQAKKLGLEIPEPISADYVIKGIRNGKSLAVPGMIGTHILVDDAECILQQFIMAGIRAEIDTYAITLRNDKGHELTIWGEDLNEKYGLDEPDKITSKSTLTKEQISILEANGITNPNDYVFEDVYTKTEIHPSGKSSHNIIGNIEVKKCIRFKNTSSNDIIEIEIDTDEIIKEYYLGEK